MTAVADVFDALTTRRPYKPPFPRQKAFDILEEGRAKQFDPRMLDAFFRRHQEILQVQIDWRIWCEGGFRRTWPAAGASSPGTEDPFPAAERADSTLEHGPHFKALVVVLRATGHLASQSAAGDPEDDFLARI